MSDPNGSRPATKPDRPPERIRLRDPRAPRGAPNVVTIILDDVGFAQLGCFGSDIATPNIDALAASVPASLEQVFSIGLEISAPVVIALVISDAAFGLISRAVPQMNVFFVGLPAKIILGLAVVGASLPFVAAHLTNQMQASVLQALETLKQ